MRHFVGGCVASVCMLAGGALSAQTVVVDQTPSSFSNNGPFANIFHQRSLQRVADNFTLGANTSVTSVRWWGYAIKGGPNGPTNLDNIASFQVDLLADSSGAPGALLDSETFATLSAAPMVVGTGPFGSDVYEFTATFTSPILLTGGTQYWFAINANVTNPATNEGIFNWTYQGGTLGDTVFATDGTFSPVDGTWDASVDQSLSMQVLGLEVTDSDGDGLNDIDEVFYGTNPNDPDTDGDGLMDGAEVELLNEGGCHDPLNPDSDGDTLLDGDEATAGLNPCSVDTDGDTVPDNLDPSPLDPGVTPAYIEASLRDLADQVSAMPLSAFTGFNNNMKKAKRNAIASALNSAANSTSNGNYFLAELTLEVASLFFDDVAFPPDFMVPGPAKTGLQADVEAMIYLLMYL